MFRSRDGDIRLLSLRRRRYGVTRVFSDEGKVDPAIVFPFILSFHEFDLTDFFQVLYVGSSIGLSVYIDDFDDAEPGAGVPEG